MMPYTVPSGAIATSSMPTENEPSLPPPEKKPAP